MRTAPSKKSVRAVTKALCFGISRWGGDRNYSLRTSPLFWTDVFTYYYREAPCGNDDPRWDELFKLGFQLLRDLQALRAR